MDRLQETYSFRSEINGLLKEKIIEKNIEREKKILQNSIDSYNANLDDAIRGITSSNYSSGQRYTTRQLKSFYSVLVASCIDIRAESASQAVISLRKRNKSTNKYEPLEWHPFLDLIQRPNLTYEDLSFSDILEYSSKSQDIFGNSYWYLPKGGAKLPAELWTIPADEIKIKTFNGFGMPLTYEREFIQDNGTTKKIIIPEDEIIHNKTYNPWSQHYGIGIIQKAGVTLAINNQLSEYQYKLLRKGGIPKYILQNTNDLKDEVIDAQQEIYDAKHKGAVNNIILNAGYEVKPLQLTPAEMDFIVSKKFSKEEILNMFRVPGTKLGDGGGTNKSTAQVNSIDFNHNIIRPVVQKWAGKLSMYMFKIYKEDIIVDFTLPLPTDPEIIMKQFEVMGNMAKEAKDNPYSLQVLNDFRSALKLNFIS